MKILITTDWYEPVVNGVVTSVLNLITELRKKGHQVRVLTLSESTHSQYKDQVYYFASINMNKIYPHARATMYVGRNLIEDIVRWHPDIIHSQCEFSSFQYAKRISHRLNIPIVHTYHTMYEDYTHYFFPSKRMGRQIVSGLSRHFLSNVQCVIAPTEKIRKALDSYCILRRICVVPTGIDLSRYAGSLSDSEKTAIRESLGIPEHKHILLSLGRLAKEKNVELLIDYVNNMERDDVCLVIVGGGPYKHELEKHVEKRKAIGKVFFTGMVLPQLTAKYYRFADIFVCASRSEAQGLTYVEALASGLPAVCFNDPCIRDVVLDNYDGYQFTDFNGFSAAINKILDDDGLRAKMSANARELTQKEFSTTAFADKVEAIYKSEIERYK